ATTAGASTPKCCAPGATAIGDSRACASARSAWADTSGSGAALARGPRSSSPSRATWPSARRPRRDCARAWPRSRAGGGLEYPEGGIRARRNPASLDAIPPCPPRRNALQRLFTAFPSGAPGLGLLLLRLAVAVRLFDHGAACLLGGAASTGARAVGMLAAMTAALLVLGLVTPVSAALAAAAAAGLALSLLPAPARNAFAPGAPAVAVALAAAALALIGPGAFSVDAALFGRREINIPRRAHED